MTIVIIERGKIIISLKKKNIYICKSDLYYEKTLRRQFGLDHFS